MADSFDSLPLIKSQNARTPTWFWNGTQQININSSLVNALESYSDQYNTNCRICFHASPEESCHTMLLNAGHEHTSAFTPFKVRFCIHFERPNGFSYSRKSTPLLPTLVHEGTKAPAGFIHAIGISSERCTYLETSAGPFDPSNDAIYPSWASEWYKSYISGKVLR